MNNSNVIGFGNMLHGKWKKNKNRKSMKNEEKAPANKNYYVCIIQRRDIEKEKRLTEKNGKKIHNA